MSDKQRTIWTAAIEDNLEMLKELLDKIQS